MSFVRSVLVPLGVAASALLWRFAGTWPAALASGVTVAVAVLGMPLAAQRTGVALGTLALLAAGIAAAGLFPAIWPCEADCSEGRDYGYLLGYPVLWFAVPGYLILALLALSEWRRPRHRFVTQMGAWMVLGASLYYGLVALQLEMVCPHCLAVHTAVFCFWGVLLQDSSRALVGAAASLAAAALLHWHYHPEFLRRAPGEHEAVLAAVPVESTPGTAPGEAPPETAPAAAPRPSSFVQLPPEERSWFAQADAGRCLGSVDAPLRLEVLQAFSCSRCADSHEKVSRAVAAALQAGKVRLVSRHFLTPGNEASRQLVRLAFAAAATGGYAAYKKEAYAAQILPAGLTLAELRGAHSLEAQLRRLLEHIDAAPLLAVIAEHGAAVELLVDLDDKATAPRTKEGAPQVLLIDASSGEVLEEWARDLNYPVIQQTIRRYTGS